MRKLQILSAVLFTLVVMNVLTNFMGEFMYGFNTGMMVSEERLENFFMRVRPNAECEMMETDDFTIEGKPLMMEVNEMNLFVSDSDIMNLDPRKRSRFKLIKGVSMLMAFGLTIALVWMVVLIVKLFVSVFRTQFFEGINTNRINRIAWILITIEVLGGVFMYMNDMATMELIELHGYAINWTGYFSSNIILGVVMLVMNEFIRMAATMKKEQELTI